jgi:DNA-binding GntR family transcriptional regulator
MSLTDAEKAYTQIKEKIVTVQMPPGSIISEATLMQELRLGRTPIREALRQLRAENLVFVAPRRGMFVADIAITDLNHIYEVRLELESLGAALSAERATLQQMKALNQLLRSGQRVNQNDVRAVLGLDRQFHKLLADVNGNRFLSSQIDLFYNLSLRIWYLALERIKPEDLNTEAHWDIVSAVEARDSDAARQHMRSHIRHFQNVIKYYL